MKIQSDPPMNFHVRGRLEFQDLDFICSSKACGFRWAIIRFLRVFSASLLEKIKIQVLRFQLAPDMEFSQGGARLRAGAKRHLTKGIHREN